MRENGVALMPYHCADGWIYEAQRRISNQGMAA
jgi:hypothetical protein